MVLPAEFRTEKGWRLPLRSAWRGHLKIVSLAHSAAGCYKQKAAAPRCRRFPMYRTPLAFLAAVVSEAKGERPAMCLR